MVRFIHIQKRLDGYFLCSFGCPTAKAATIMMIVASECKNISQQNKATRFDWPDDDEPQSYANLPSVRTVQNASLQWIGSVQEYFQMPGNPPVDQLACPESLLLKRQQQRHGCTLMPKKWRRIPTLPMLLLQRKDDRGKAVSEITIYICSTQKDLLI
jgi:hypothetical protein